MAGKKEGFRDRTRGTLFFDVADIIDRTRPKAFLLENVEGILRHKRGQTFRIILETLVNELDYHVIGVSEKEGKLKYDNGSFLVNSRHFGIPQNRPRVYIVGFDKRLYGAFIEGLNALQLPKRNDKKIYTSLNDLLEFGAAPEFYLAEGYLETLKKHRARHKEKGNGFGYIVVNDPDNPLECSNAILATGGSGRERNLVYDPQPHIGGMVVSGKHTPLNKEGIRVMTPTEWAKLQGFANYAFVKDGKDEFSFPPNVSRAQQYKQLGNSVTIQVIEEMAKLVATTLDFLEGRKESCWQVERKAI